DHRAGVLRRRHRAGAGISALQDQRAHVADRDLRAHGDPREPDPVDLDRRLSAPGVAVHASVAPDRDALRGADGAPRLRRRRALDTRDLGVAPLELPRQGRARQRAGRADGRRVRRQPPPARAAARRPQRRLRGGRGTLHRAQPHAGAVADLLVDRRGLRRRDHRPPRQRPRPARRLRLHRRQRGADHGGHGAGLGAARVLHAADRDPASAARAVIASRLPPALPLVVPGLPLALVPTLSLHTTIDGGPGVFLAAVPIPTLFGAPATTLYHLALAVAFLSAFAALAIYRSRWGMGLFAIRDDEDVAEVLGVPTYRYKLVAFALSCFIAGLIGGI